LGRSFKGFVKKNKKLLYHMYIESNCDKKMTNEESTERVELAQAEVILKASGRGKPGDKPEIPRGAPKDTENSSSESES
jgi:hypothetical protein